MAPPSPCKYRESIVRQLSLQNPTSVQFLGGRGLKKQSSEDDGRVLESVEVTGQGWNGNGGQLRVGSGNSKVGQTKIIGTRPKPVKVALVDKKPENSETSAGVEVIATKCQSQPRPSSLRTQRLRSPLLGNKDTLVYTRLQLAERLRNAWSEREKMKPNINIFLTRPPDTASSENNEQGPDGPTDPSAPFRDIASALSDPSAPLDKKRKSMRVRAFSQDFSHPEDLRSKNGEFVVPKADGSETDLEGMGKYSSRSEENEVSGSGQMSKIEIRVTRIDKNAEDRENKPPNSEETSNWPKRCRNKISESFSGEKSETESKDAAVTSAPTAQDRRANFRRNNFLQKTINETFSSGFKETDGKIGPKPTQKKPPLVRAFSAPCRNDQPSDLYRSANQQIKMKTSPQKRLQPTASYNIPITNNDDVALTKERVKSAPVRRRFKSASARRKSKEKDSSDEEKETTKDAAAAAATKKTSKRSQLKKGADIVTMVSLVSPAASDTEESVINLPMESWRAEEKEEPHRSGKITGNVEESKNSSLVRQKFVSLRKTTKSVTFQPHPILTRNYSASFPSRRAPAGTPVIVPTPVVTNPALTPAQLIERDKRALAFSGIDGRGIKRKFFRSFSESVKDDDISDWEGKEAEDIDGVSKNIEKSKESNDESGTKATGEPDFKCQKEKECWNLYQKMLEKGVSVSFDTVLRGMLTPTEYRLRKNYLSNF